MTSFEQPAAGAVSLAQRVRAHRDKLLATWIQLLRARGDLSVEALPEHLPLVIERLADQLEREGSGPAGWPDFGLAPEPLAILYAQLRKALLRVLEPEQAQLSLDERERLHEALDEALARSATRPREDLDRALLELAVEQCGDGIILADEHGVLRLVNAEAKRQHGLGLTGVGPPDWVARYGLSTEDGQPLPLEQVALYRALKGEAVRDARMAVRRAGGELRILTVNAAPLHRADGTLAGAVLNSRDETERLAGERERDETLASLKTMLATAPVGLYFVDRSLRVTHLNTTLARALGTTPEAAIGRTLHEVLPALADLLTPLLRQVLKTGEPVLHRELTTTVAGQIRHWMTSYYAVRDEEGEPFRVGALVVDLTERKRAEERQRFFLDVGRVLAEAGLDSDSMLRTIARLAVPALADTCTIDLLDEHGELRRVAVVGATSRLQALLERTWELTPRIGSGSTPARAVETARPVLVREFPPGALERAASSPEHLAVLEAIGPRSVAFVPLVASGKTLGLLNLCSTTRPYDERDLALAKGVADRAALAIHHARLYEQAREAVHIREEVLAIVSHDLRNPLSALRISAALLLKELGGDEALAGARKHAEAIQRASERMKRLIANLLDFASLESGTYSVRLGECDAGELLDEVLEMMAPLAEQKALRLELERDGLAGQRIRCDRERLLQVFSNVVGNALKFTPEGGTVTFGGEWRGSEARFHVRDTGPGIPEDELPHLFERFWRKDRGGQRGTGLGLHIAQRLVELHHGRIWAETRPGEGATFYFTVPASDPAG